MPVKVRQEYITD